MYRLDYMPLVSAEFHCGRRAHSVLELLCAATCSALPLPRALRCPRSRWYGALGCYGEFPVVPGRAGRGRGPLRLLIWVARRVARPKTNRCEKGGFRYRVVYAEQENKKF